MSLKQQEAFFNMPMATKPLVRKTVPWVSYGYMAVCIALFALGMLMGFHEDGLSRFGLFAPAVEAGEWWRIFSCHFLHGGILHVAFNVWVAYGLGRNLEASIGHWFFLWASLMGALGTATASMLFSPHALMIGASGVILSWAGVMLPLATRHARKELLFWFAQIAILSLLPGISLAGHAGGVAAGLVCGLALLQYARGHRGWLLLATLLIASLCAWVAYSAELLPREKPDYRVGLKTPGDWVVLETPED